MGSGSIPAVNFPGVGPILGEFVRAGFVQTIPPAVKPSQSQFRANTNFFNELVAEIDAKYGEGTVKKIGEIAASSPEAGAQVARFLQPIIDSPQEFGFTTQRYFDDLKGVNKLNQTA